MVLQAGLEGVVAARTRLSDVDGERGELIIGGFPLAELAPNARFEETTWLLWHGELPTASQLDAFTHSLAARRALLPATRMLLEQAARTGVTPMTALRMAIGTLPSSSGASEPAINQGRPEGRPRREQLDAVGDGRPEDRLRRGDGPFRDDPQAILAGAPTIVAAFWRLSAGLPPVEPRIDLSHAANFLYMLSGEVPDDERVRALETYLNTVIDHGLNASTFAARVIASTGADLVSATVGAVGALAGPLHGGAPGPALDMVFEIGDASRAESVLRAKLEAGEKLMGFGHRVYRVRDPRADVLGVAAERLFTRSGDMALYALARSVEAAAVRLLEEYKPGRRLQTNVEFYTALLLHGLGFDVALFTPTFAISRIAGWIAHVREQREANRIIRPQSEYDGPRRRRWMAVEDRGATATTPLP
ncbi:MAG TPA: citrate synthase/methylcitrate synthase [Vicinamibacterales bacterium]|nr:citrate synthase/methylcitrate synthase [Vicinamibacterales bacterium]